MRYVIREKLFHLAEDSAITDESGQPVFHVDGKIFSLHHTLVMRDMAGNEVATVRQHMIALTPTFEITRAGMELAEVRKKLFSPFIERFTIDIPGPDDLEVAGSLFEHNFTVNRQGATVATVSRAWVSLSASYGVDIAPGQDDALILATVLALDLVQDEMSR
ncbi:MAG TPA: LURP-one-related family protein [Gemmatimonadaceae bacterium]